jgi:hypothetical protein
MEGLSPAPDAFASAAACSQLDSLFPREGSLGLPNSDDPISYLEKEFLPCIQRETSIASAAVRVFGELIDAACVEVAYECIRLKSIGAFSSTADVTLAPTKLPAVPCPHCNASVGISKFVPHLATCMNIGGRRRTRPSASLVSSSRDGHVSPSEFDFGSDDDDAAFGSRKKKVGHSMKLKPGETKTYGSKSKNKAISFSNASESTHIMSDPFEFL